MNSSMERKILAWVYCREDYRDIVFPHLKRQYFAKRENFYVFSLISDYVGKYNRLPNKEALMILVSEQKINDELKKQVVETIEFIFSYDCSNFPDLDFAIEETEKYCKMRSVYDAIYKSIDIFEGKSKKHGIYEIPELLKDAINVSFSNEIGHDYFDDAEKRWEFYHKKEKKYKFGIKWFDDSTQGGVSPKTLNVFIAPTGIGKTMTMCHFAAHYIRSGYNVLYITLEMAEERIAERIDANLMNIPVQQIRELPKNMYIAMQEKIRKNCGGRLIIKEYPTSTAGVMHFQALLNELKLKKNFKPDIVFIDYLNLCVSARYPKGESMYLVVKSIAEELRGFATENNVVVFSATQANRNAYNSSDIALKDTSESIGLPQTTDFMVGIVETDEMREQGKLMFKILKNRYSGINDSFAMLNVDKSKSLLYEDGATPNNTFSEMDRQEITMACNINAGNASDDPFADFNV